MVQDKYVHIYNKVKESMEVEHLFLRPDISLRMLSRVIGTNTVYLSKAVNQGFGCSFSTLICKYRLNYVIKKALAEKRSVEEVSAECAFWSRSTLYEAFRQFVGMTPGKYLDMKRKDESKKYEV